MYKKRRFAKMYETYADDIYRYFYVHMRDVSLSEDLTADTFMRAYKALDRFDFSQPRPWLYKIARNLMTDHWRKHKPQLIEGDDDIVADQDSVEEVVDKELDKQRVHKALGQLPRSMRDVVAMRFLLGYSARQTAEALDITEANVRVVQHRALQRLKGILA